MPKAYKPKKTLSPDSNFPVYYGRKGVFDVINTCILIFLGLLCLLPFWYIICISLSSNGAVLAGNVRLLPIDFNIDAYQYVLYRNPFWKAFQVTISRVVVGLPINLLLSIMCAYPLSKSSERFHFRSAYVWFFFITMLFNGGLIPNYLLINKLGLMDTIWALILPQGINVFNMLLILSFFRQLSSEIEDAAFVDGASHWRILWQIFVPISIPVIATVTLFSMVYHWNSWFDGMIYMRDATNYPLQTYLRNVIINFDFSRLTPAEQSELAQMNVRTVKSSQMIIGAIPILIAYPFLQRFFISGITLGSVKG